MNSEHAKGLARIAHLGQMYGVEDYFAAHVTDVARRVSEDLRADDDLQAVAWLHDVIEDTSVDFGHLSDEGLTIRQLAALCALTRYDDEEYGAYIKRVCSNPDATLVKYHDLESNMAADPPIERLRKYNDAWVQVNKALEKRKCPR